MYETTDAFTKYLPAEYSGLVKFVQVNGRTKIAIRNVISEYIPNPTFNKVAPPGAFDPGFGPKNPPPRPAAGWGGSGEKPPAAPGGRAKRPRRSIGPPRPFLTPRTGRG